MQICATITIVGTDLEFIIFLEVTHFNPWSDDVYTSCLGKLDQLDL